MRALVSNFVQGGISLGQRVVCWGPADFLADLGADLCGSGLDVAALTQSSQVALSTASALESDSSEVVARLASEVDRASGAAASGVRLVCVSRAAEGGLAAFEAALGSLARRCNAIVLCACDRTLQRSQIILERIPGHTHLTCRGTVYALGEGLRETAVSGPGADGLLAQLLEDLVARRDLERRVAELGAEVEREKRSARDFRAAAAAATDGFFACDAEGRFLEVDDGCCALLGRAREELLSKSLEGVGQAALAAEVRASGERGRRRASLSPRDGRPLEVELSTTRAQEGRLWVFMRSVAASTEGSSQAQKMEPVTRLAGGVAHAFNNLLTAITGYSELLLDSFMPGDPRREDLLEVHRAGERAVTLTRQLLAFGRRQVLRSRLLDLNAMVGNLERQLRRLIGEGRELRIELAPGLPAVWADPRQIEQVIVSLAVNARDAMPSGGGRLTLTTRAAPRRDPERSLVAGAPEPLAYVEVAVEDTGSGMGPETLAHLFEPFFTTKEKGKGTGLGLAASHGIVAQCGGQIDVESELGKGSIFRVRLPAAEPGRRA